MRSIHTFVVLAYKESSFLEECIKSVLNQELKTEVVIATSTPNSYIDDLAKKYNLKIKVNNGKKGIGADFEFALGCVNSELVTIVHQDDIYDYNYAYDVINAYKNNKKNKPIIVFTDYYEIKGKEYKKVYSSINLRIKRFLLFPIRFHILGKYKFFKRWVIRFGNAISCPAVTFVSHNIKHPVFDFNLKCNVDWEAWERLSKLDGSFIFVNKIDMGHRIYSESTTSDIIRQNIRTKEDYKVYLRFWPKWFASLLTKIYKNSEKSNEKDK